ncbi:MAG TPA: hypothetical protein V6D46_04935 [Coleofasciculaceae cyanobacterium]
MRRSEDRSPAMIHELVEVAINAAVEVAGEVVFGAVGEVIVGQFKGDRPNGDPVDGDPIDSVDDDQQNPEKPIEAVSGNFGEIFAAASSSDPSASDSSASDSAWSSD